MKRELLAQKLERIVAAIEQGAVPLPVRELHVFGSFRRGAIECGDLDLLLVVGKPPSLDWYIQQLGVPIYDCRLPAKYYAAMCKPLRKPGEKIDILVANDTHDYVGPNQKIKPDDLLLLWTPQDRDWRGKLAAISVDTSAGRHARDHLLDLHRTASSVTEMDTLVKLLEHKRLKLTRIPVEKVRVDVPRKEQARILRALSLKLRGAATLEVTRYAYGWLYSEGQKAAPYGYAAGTVISSQDGSIRINVGKVSLGAVTAWLYDDSEVKKVCLIPHLRKKQPNELLVFERGSAWTGDTKEDVW